jgi:type III restriction enzyme
LATGTGKSFVLYGIAVILLAEGVLDRVLVLCPSNTIEAGLLDKFKQLATDATLRDLMPEGARIATPRVINASETVVDGALCVENYHAILEHVNSSIRDSLKGKGARVAVLNNEAHHVANESGTVAGKWKSFLLSLEYCFRYVLGGFPAPAMWLTSISRTWYFANRCARPSSSGSSRRWNTSPRCLPPTGRKTAGN